MSRERDYIPPDPVLKGGKKADKAKEETRRKSRWQKKS